MQTPQALIVEDYIDLAEIFAQALKEAGYDVVCLSDGQAAQTYLANHTPDLLMLDIHLPQLSGTQLLKIVKADARFANTQIIIGTADSRRIVELQDEADLILQKPISYLQLTNLSRRLTAVMHHLQT